MFIKTLLSLRQIFLIILFSIFCFGRQSSAPRDLLLQFIELEYKDSEVMSLDTFVEVENNKFSCYTAYFQSQQVVKTLKSEKIKILYPPVDILTWINVMKNDMDVYSRDQFPEKIFFGDDPTCKDKINYRCYAKCLICSGQYFVTKTKLSEKYGKEEKFEIKNEILYGYQIGEINTKFQDTQLKVYFDLLQCNFPDIAKTKSNSADIVEEVVRTMNESNLKERGFYQRCKCQSIEYCAECRHEFSRCNKCNTEGIWYQKQCIKNPLPGCQELDYREEHQRILARNDDEFKCKTCNKGFLKVENGCQTSCPSNYYESIPGICCKLGFGSSDQQSCEKCDNGCTKCGGKGRGDLICQQCSPKFILNDGKCEYPCKLGETIVNNKCVKCQQQYCKFCSGDGPYDCEECFEGFIFQEGTNGKKQCVPCTENVNCPPEIKCRKRQFRNKQYPYECKKCSENCNSCTNEMICTECESGYLLKQGFCSYIQYDSTYESKATKQNQACNFACSQCKDGSNLCDECSADFSFYVELNGQKLCFEKCPRFYTSNQANPNKCEIQSTLTTDMKFSAQKSIDFTQEIAQELIWQFNKSNSCPSKCEYCLSGNDCLQCTQGYFWNSSTNQCQPCHATCSSCKGPLKSDCTLCVNFSQSMPIGQTGTCNSSVNTNLIYSKDITNDLQTCKNSYKIIQGYDAKLSTLFSKDDQKWSKSGILSENRFDFSEFRSLYPYLVQINQYCNSQQITFSTIQEDGQLIVLLSSILASQQVKLSGDAITPLILIKQAQNQNAIINEYLFKPLDTFNCSQLKCKQSIDETQLSFEVDSENVLKINKNDFVFTSNKSSFECDQNVENKEIDSQSLNEFEDLVSSTSENKRYYILNICGVSTSDTQKSPTAIPVLISKSLGQGFYQFVHPSFDNQTFTLSISGANTAENSALKKCYPQYNSPFVYYKVQGYQVYEVKKQNRYKSQTDSYQQRVKLLINNEALLMNTSAKCKCGKPLEYIILNDGKDGMFDQNSSDKFLTPYINKQDILSLLSNQNYANIKPENIPRIYQQKLFETYIDNVISKAKKCYPLEKFTQCAQNVLIDVVYSNFGKCLTDNDFQVGINSQNLQQIANSLNKSTWCSSNQFRCTKNIQTLQSCI